ncbi:hypothetical protein BC1002_6659 [Paraburkholderia atlantica]|uniref:Uncharacterized protein n=1 Tax=Paraburkholderia atlantica TaxID=2654982 RepID=D5WMQ2_PARAM|nr:hypothetical protein BC1002_6659 [Paraburkholderia atlantica]
MLQSSDVVHSLERGVALDGATGALVGLVALAFPPAELAIAGGAQHVPKADLEGAEPTTPIFP